MVEELHAYFERLPRAIRHNVTSLVGAGNAIRSNDRLRDEAVRQFGLPVHVPTHSEEGAVGAALTAAVGSGRLSRLKPRVNGWVDSLRTHRAAGSIY